jgi:hypothetical protein
MSSHSVLPNRSELLAAIEGEFYKFVTGIYITVSTGDESDAGTDGDIYLGLGGREFHLDTDLDDFESGGGNGFMLGSTPPYPTAPSLKSNVKCPDLNDPSKGLQILSADLDIYPVYIRFKGLRQDDRIHLAEGQVDIIETPRPPVGSAANRLDPVYLIPDIWLGARMGEIVYLRRWR